MRTGLSKKQKTTSIFFDEASPIIEVCTYNTSLKNRLSEYAGKYPAECRLVDDDERLSAGWWTTMKTDASHSRSGKGGSALS